MTLNIIEKISADLGIERFTNESEFNYECRVIYSAMASWLKAIALDRTPENRETKNIGISRRYMLERGDEILKTFYKMYPDVSNWFEPLNTDESAIALIRRRLLQHGDLLNAGFVSNIVLSRPHNQQMAFRLETVYGKVLEKDCRYFGVAMVRKNEHDYKADVGINVQEWLNELLTKAGWSEFSAESNTDWQYFNPACKAGNNYEAWQNKLPDAVKGIYFAKTIINNNENEYYLLNYEKKLIYRLDEFLKKTGCHRRIMYALRAECQNSLTASKEEYADHIKLCLPAWLPQAEYALLESYAWSHKNINDKLNWLIPAEIWNIIEQHIQKLGIRIVEK